METSSSAKPAPPKKENIIRKVWNYRRNLTIEVVALFWLLPSTFDVVSVYNLSLEKACRVNAGYDPIICENFLEKSLNAIDCDQITLPDKEDDSNSTENGMMPVLTNMTVPVAYEVGTDFFNKTVCQAEIDAQTLVAISNGIRVPIASVFTIIVILFAGGWSDRKGLRKPCLIFPLIGELLAAVAFLIAAIFMDQIPMHFNNILEKVFPAMFGGSTLMVMGIYSYLSATTSEEDRVFRFGIFAVCAQIVPLVGFQLSGILYITAGYIIVFIISIVLFGCGILYIIFFVKEIKPSKHSEDVNEQHDNPAFDVTDTENRTVSTKIEELKIKPAEIPVKSRTCLAEFFDPTLAYNCLQVFLTKRPNNYRIYIIIIVIIYPLFLQPLIVEIDYIIFFGLKKLKWGAEDYSLYNTISSAVAIIGTAIITGVFSKILKMSNSMVGIVSTLGTIIARPIYAFSTSTAIFYLAVVVDMFVGTKTLAVKSVVSTMVEEEELGRVYAVMGITDAIGGFIFPPIYSYVYTATVEKFTGAFFILGEVFFIPVVILLAIIYVKLEWGNKPEEDKSEDKEKANGTNNEYESTYM